MKNGFNGQITNNYHKTIQLDSVNKDYYEKKININICACLTLLSWHYQYENTKNNEKRFLSLTSLKVLKFVFLLRHFEPISENYFRWHTLHGQLQIIPKYEIRSNETLGYHNDKLFF